MTKRKPKVSLLWRTEFVAYKITDKTTGDARLAVTRAGEGEDQAFKNYAHDVSSRSVPWPDVDHLTAEARMEALRKWDAEVKTFRNGLYERRSDFTIAISREASLQR